MYLFENNGTNQGRQQISKEFLGRMMRAAEAEHVRGVDMCVDVCINISYRLLAVDCR